MKMNHDASIKPWKMMGLAGAALALCLCTAAPSAETLIAYAEPEGVQPVAAAEADLAASAETTTEFKGWYACGTREDLNDLGSASVAVRAGAWGYNGSGRLVGLSHIDLGASVTYVDEENWDSFIGLGLKIYSDSEKAAVESDPRYADVSWWPLYERFTVEVAQPVEPNTIEPDEETVTQPEKKPTPGETNTEEPVPTPTPDTSKPAIPEPPEVTDPGTPEVTNTTSRGTQVNEKPSVTTESDIMSIRCRESEAEAKMMELEAQGYEIVHVEKLPKWYR